MTTWYRDGTVTLTNGSKAVTGVGTEWVDFVLPGGIFFTPTGLYEVESVASDGLMQLVTPYSGPTISNTAYAIAPTQGYVTELSRLLGLVLSDFGSLKDAWTTGTFASAVDLLNKTDAAKGANLLGYDGGTLRDIADYNKPMQSYAALRAYTGRAKGVRITTPGVAGNFSLDDDDTTTLDDGGTTIVDASGRRWKRSFSNDINIRWFGTKCDGVTDDTVGVHAAIRKAVAVRGVLFHPGGTCRVTAGFTNATAQGSITICGCSPNREGYASGLPSVFMLDSADAASFFYKLAAAQSIYVRDVMFASKQYVKDREFFVYANGLHYQLFDNVVFESVEQPIVWKAGTYFQNATYRNVTFRNSGTFHSKSPDTAGTLIGTYLLLDNVHHESTMPVNTEKIVCNLQGIRQIEGRSFLLEGVLPSHNEWTILRLNNTYDAVYTRMSFAIITSFHSEWSGANRPLSTVDQIGGTVKFDYMFGPAIGSPYRLFRSARVIVEETSFVGTTDFPSALFLKDNSRCIVEFVSCSTRSLDLHVPGFIHRNTQWADSTDGLGQVVLSNDAAQEIWRWDGSVLDGEQARLQTFGGTIAYHTDATYGRKIALTPASGLLSMLISVKTGGGLSPGDQVVMCGRARLPTFTSGLWAFNVDVDGTGNATKYYDASYSGQMVDFIVPFVLLTSPARIGLGLSKGTTSGVTTPLELMSGVIYHGNSIPRHVIPCYPKNTINFGIAPPTVGTWARGDRFINSAPASGSPKGWICTADGGPGTWLSEGNL